MRSHTMRLMLRRLWLAVHHHRRPIRCAKRMGRALGVLLGLELLLAGCNNSGNQGRLAPQSGPAPVVERQAVDNLPPLYRPALRHADIDRVDALLAPAALQAQAEAVGHQAALRQAGEGGGAGGQAPRAALTG